MTHPLPGLPPGVTAESRQRFQLTQHMVADCPAARDLALALTGSVSRGLVDATCAHLILDTLALLPSTPDVERACTHLQRGLGTH